MDIRDAAQYIRDTVPMQSILDLYGYKPKHGFMPCPFHPGDHTASLKVYPGSKGWHCFGCGAGGSVIDFVMQHEDCSFRNAVIAINRAMRLGLIEDDCPIDSERRSARRGIFEAMAALLYQQIDDKEKEIEIRLRRGTQETMRLYGKPPQERTAREWDMIQILTEDMQHDEYLKERCEELRKGVREWLQEKKRGAGGAPSV